MNELNPFKLAKMLEELENTVELHSISAVSYTHLDVYKRQDHDRQDHTSSKRADRSRP